MKSELACCATVGECCLKTMAVNRLVIDEKYEYSCWYRIIAIAWLDTEWHQYCICV